MRPNKATRISVAVTFLAFLIVLGAVFAVAGVSSVGDMGVDW